ncbi:hypothetical protein AMTRI_Chr01g134200 [Amborella trichopoda]|uniref:Uncharacterized protein n=1 Tax=Amborella trichopoda TaxID=13333 RepID=W1Q0A1_AMBTC|nr:uncharacterized protein LOC18442401 [Amborella trichopoda]ERN14148.1 hypothetical protein AMTR_s00021p00251020 [Amborella trichopoda]|eukprot:XP_006852681.1 uncharacterized protein LOC18442401 [Amborella trichopoda]
MGNCMETCNPSLECGQQTNPEEREEKWASGDGGFRDSGFQDGSLGYDSGLRDGGIKVKIVVTRQELEWLALKCKEKGGMRVEELLLEIKKSRSYGYDSGGFLKSSNGVWRPGLESIMESPETQSVEMIR